MSETQAPVAKPDLFVFVRNLFVFIKTLTWDIAREINIGRKTHALPTYLCLGIGIFLSLSLMIYVDGWVFSLCHKHRLLVPAGKFRDWLGLFSLFFGFYSWGLYRLLQRRATVAKLDRIWTNAGLETRLKEKPKFYSDLPIDEFGRKLRVRASGIPLDSFVNVKPTLESEFNIYIANMENPEGNKEFVDIVYTTEEMPALWTIDNIYTYKDFSFPIGKSYRGEIKANLKDIAHFLVAGESGGGKSTFIRMMLTILLANNDEIEIYYLDFKAGMENQVFSGFSNLQCIDDFSTAATKMAEIKRVLDIRMQAFKNAKARNLEMYNKSVMKKELREKRIVVVVDEIAELMPNFKGKANSDLVEINSTLNRISRMGRAVGINLVVGVQKPDARNLDPTIKANLSGVVCFAVSHFNQSTIVLGNSRAADLNKEYKGRAIWKHGLEMVEVQAPLLTEEDVINVRGSIDQYWNQNTQTEKDKSENQLNSLPVSENSEA